MRFLIDHFSYLLNLLLAFVRESDWWTNKQTNKQTTAIETKHVSPLTTSRKSTASEIRRTSRSPCKIEFWLTGLVISNFHFAPSFYTIWLASWVEACGDSTWGVLIKLHGSPPVSLSGRFLARNLASYLPQVGFKSAGLSRKRRDRLNLLLWI